MAPLAPPGYATDGERDADLLTNLKIRLPTFVS